MTEGVAVRQQRSTVWGLLDKAAGVHAQRTALIDGPSGASVTYRRLGERVAALEGWLHTKG